MARPPASLQGSGSALPDATLEGSASLLGAASLEGSATLLAAASLPHAGGLKQRTGLSGALGFALSHGGLINAQAFHGGKLALLFGATKLTNAQAFGTHSLGEVTLLSATKLTNAQAFGTHGWSLSYGATKHANVQAFGSHELALDPVTLSATKHSNAQAFGSHGWAMVYPATKHTNAQAFGSHELALVPVTLGATKHTNAQAFGSQAWSHAYAATKHANAQAFGGHEISEPSAGITIGTTGTLTYDVSDGSVYTFTTPPTIDGGGAKLLMIGYWITSFGARGNDHTNAVDAFTLNGEAPDLQLFEYMDNSTNPKYVQAVAAIWDAPTSGDVVVDLGFNATSCGIAFFNLTGLNASPLGVLVREQVSTGTALAFQATTTAANSLLVSINGARGTGKGPFAFDDANFTSLGETGGAFGGGNGSWDIGYRNGLAVGTYDCGGDWTNSDSERIGGAAFELKAA